MRSRLGRLVLRGLEAIPAVQQERAKHERSAPYWLAATEMAFLPISDEEALERLRRRLAPDPVALADAIDFISYRRSDFISDRQYRLLKALAEDAPVRGMDPALADLFQQEELLGRAPLKTAFQRLCELEPGLAELAAAHDASGRPPATHELVGMGARRGTPLLISDISASIARQYLEISSGAIKGDVNIPYFDAPKIQGHSSAFGFGGVTAPSRQHAQN